MSSRGCGRSSLDISRSYSIELLLSIEYDREISLEDWDPGRDEEIAASVGAHRDLGPAYDDAVSAGLVERIGAEVDRRVDERISQYQGDTRPVAGSDPAVSRPAQHLPAVHSGGQISWQQAVLALGSMVIGAITSASINVSDGNGTWPIIVIWIAIVFINMTIFRAGRPFRRDRRSAH